MTTRRELIAGTAAASVLVREARAAGPARAAVERYLARIKEIDQPGVLSLNKPNFQGLHEAAHCEPEIIPHQDEGLHAASIALPQGLGQFRGLVPAMGVQPLLELVDDQEHLLARGDASAPPQLSQRFGQSLILRQVGTTFA